MPRIEIALGELVFDVRVAGPEVGEVVVLLHGFPQHSYSWRHQVRALADAGYRVVAPDQRGYSPGARPDAVEDYGRTQLVGDVLGLADAVGAERFHLVGHDWGGAVAWQVAGRHPERLRSLTVLTTPHPVAFLQGLQGELGGDQQERSGYMAMFREEGAEDQFLANGAQLFRMVFAATGLTDEEAAPYVETLGSREALRAALNWYRASSVADTDGLGPIVTPTLYVWSTEDPALAPETAEATEPLLEGPRRVVKLEGVGHWIPEQAAEQTNALLLEHFASAASSDGYGGRGG
jgi:pimeloyl-ACP methyl ester carboxylesterase